MSFDVVVIGGGVNALTAAAYLAKAGRGVAVVCPDDEIGGLCSRHEFYPGYYSPGILSDTSMFRKWIVDELDLRGHGLVKSTSSKTVAFGKDQQIVFSESTDKTTDEIARVSEPDAESYRAMKAFYQKIGGPISQFLNSVPADIVDPETTDLWSLFKRGFQLRRLGKKDMLEVLRLAPMTVYDWLDEWFENNGLKAALALPAVTEGYSAPWSPGTNANLLIREVTRGPRVQGDGLALVEALESAARSNGVQFEPGIVDSIEPGRGVRLEDGDFMEAKTIMAAYGPKKVFLEMIDARLLSHKFEQRISKFRTRGLTSQLLLAVESYGPGVESSASRSGSRQSDKISPGPGNLNSGLPEMALIAEDLDGIEKAFDPVKYKEVTRRPCLDVYIPSEIHDDLAPIGKTVISVLVHYTPYALRGGWTPEAREELSGNVIDVLDEKIPGIKERVIGKELLTPGDIEQRYGLSGGQLYEGEHALDQLLVRPAPECSQYKTPFEGLFLCSGGSFPGGGLTGAPGALAAKLVMQE
ncbi:MAG: NAD(P)/FAD-dependent oxidoreductase [Acidobacteriota bacterium]|nr:NAD(P)/FAD-dependent oxidoreductase [Acidobacteriota bacterium]